MLFRSVAEARLQGHDTTFAQRVDRWIGDLTEVLAEEVVHAAVAVRQHRQGRVVAHRADSLLGVLHHGMEDELQVFHGEAVVELAAAQRFALPRSEEHTSELQSLMRLSYA